jgi:hypothetical protein
MHLYHLRDGRYWFALAAFLLSILFVGNLQAEYVFFKTTDTVSLKYVPSGRYLIQGYCGNRDDKRNAENQPYDITDRENYCWLFDRVPGIEGEWYYLVNMKTGLVLTQDGNDWNVSCWGQTDPIDDKQLWKLVRCYPVSEERPYSPFVIVNKKTNLALVQSHFGSDWDEESAEVWNNWDPANPKFQWMPEIGRKIGLMRLTIEKIRCIKPSTGKDGGTKFLFSAIEMAVEAGIGAATGGTGTAAATAGQQAAKEAAKQAVKQGLKVSIKEGAKTAFREGSKLVTREAVMAYAKKSATKKALKTAALEAGNHITEDSADSLVELAFDKFYGESPDQLEIRINGVSRWPNGGRDWRNIKSQDVQHTNIVYIFERDKSPTIQLIEYDSGSADDKLGSLTLDSSEVDTREHYEGVIIKNESEGSIYELTFTIEPYEKANIRKPKPVVKINLARNDLDNARINRAMHVPCASVDGQAQQPAQAMFWMRQRIFAINAAGETTAYEANNPNSVYTFPGILIGQGGPQQPKYIFPMDNRIIVVDIMGNTWVYDTSTNQIAPPVYIPGFKIGTDAQPVKGVFPMGNNIGVLNAEGQVWVHPFGNEVGQPYMIPGDPIGTGAQPPKAVFAMADHIFVINAQGDTWVNSATDRIGPAQRLDGVKIATDAQPVKAIFPVEGFQIAVVNAAGEVWSHTIVK